MEEREYSKLFALCSREYLRSLCESLSVATDMTVVLMDYRGNIEFRVQGDIPCEFCHHIRMIPEMADACVQSDVFAGMSALRSGNPYVFSCIYGIVNIMTPIIVKNELFGFLVLGHAIATEDLKEDIPSIPIKAPSFQSDPSLCKYYQESLACLPRLDRRRLDAYTHLLTSIVDNIAARMEVQSLRKELASSNVERIQQISVNSRLTADNNALKEKSLQLRTHPHFIFNALNSINQLAILEDADQTQQAILCLASILRSTVRNNADYVSLKDEVERVRSYINLQKIINDRVIVTQEIDETVLDVLVPPFFLEILVENSFIHGFEKKRGQGCLLLRISSANGKIYVLVQDDGVGIPQEQCNKLWQIRSNHDASRDWTGSSMESILFKFYEAYGAGFSWDILTNRTGGTTVEFVFPASTAFFDI